MPIEKERLKNKNEILNWRMANECHKGPYGQRQFNLLRVWHKKGNQRTCTTWGSSTLEDK